MAGLASRGKYAGNIRSLRIFLYQIHNNTMFYLENEGQGHGVKHSQWFHSIANINLYKSHTLAFFASSRRFRDINISKFVSVKM